MKQWVLPKQIKKFAFHFQFSAHLSKHDVYPVLATVPTVVFYLIDPKVFEVEWIGNAVFGFASFFIFLTWLLYRLKTRSVSRIFWLGVILSVSSILLYQYLVYGMGLKQYILDVGYDIGLLHYEIQNWRVSVDLAAFSFYQIVLIISFFTISAIKKFVAPLAYLLLSIALNLTGAFYQIAEYGLQIIIPPIVLSVAGLLPFTGLNAQYSFLYDSKGLFRSIMVIQQPRFLAIEINWPCAGILSVLIYFAVLTSLMQTLDISRLRKTIYLTLGFLGTISVNILRITALIVSYVYLNADFVVFHQYVGGLFFVVWITLFLLTIFCVEKRRLHIGQKAEQVNLRFK